MPLMRSVLVFVAQALDAGDETGPGAVLELVEHRRRDIAFLAMVFSWFFGQINHIKFRGGKFCRQQFTQDDAMRRILGEMNAFGYPPVGRLSRYDLPTTR